MEGMSEVRASALLKAFHLHYYLIGRMQAKNMSVLINST